jgi:hypothetical protein
VKCAAAQPSVPIITHPLQRYNGSAHAGGDERRRHPENVNDLALRHVFDEVNPHNTSWSDGSP